MLNTLFFQSIYSFVFGTIIYITVKLRQDATAYTEFVGIILNLGCIGAVLGLVIGAAAKDVQFASTVVPAILTPLIIFSGYLQRFENIKVWFRWLYWTSFFQWGFRSLCLTQFTQNETFDQCDSLNPVECPFGAGQVSQGIVLDILGFSGEHFGTHLNEAWPVLFIYLLVLCGACHFVIKHQAMKNRG